MQVKPFCVRVIKDGSLDSWFILYATNRRRAATMARAQIGDAAARVDVNPVVSGMPLRGRAAGATVEP